MSHGIDVCFVAAGIFEQHFKVFSWEDIMFQQINRLVR